MSRSPAPQVPEPAARVPAGDGRRLGSLYDQVYANQPGAAQTQLTVPAPVQHLTADFTGPHAVTALAHLAAAILVGLWLAQGERALWTIFGLAAEGLRDVAYRTLVAYGNVMAASAHVTLGAVVRLVTPTAEWRRFRPTGVVLLARSVVRRGPPALLAA